MLVVPGIRRSFDTQICCSGSWALSRDIRAIVITCDMYILFPYLTSGGESIYIYIYVYIETCVLIYLYIYIVIYIYIFIQRERERELAVSTIDKLCCIIQHIVYNNAQLINYVWIPQASHLTTPCSRREALQ